MLIISCKHLRFHKLFVKRFLLDRPGNWGGIRSWYRGNWWNPWQFLARHLLWWCHSWSRRIAHSPNPPWINRQKRKRKWTFNKWFRWKNEMKPFRFPKREAAASLVELKRVEEPEILLVCINFKEAISKATRNFFVKGVTRLYSPSLKWNRLNFGNLTRCWPTPGQKKSSQS